MTTGGTNASAGAATAGQATAGMPAGNGGSAVAGGASDGGAQAVADAYHSSLVPPFCLAAVQSFFDKL